MRVAAKLLLCSLGLAMAAGAVTAGAPRSVVLLSSSREIRFRSDFPAPEIQEDGIGDRVYTHPVWPDLTPQGDPGGPGLPVTRVRLAVPPRGNLELSVSVEPRGSLGGIRFPPLPEWEPQPGGPGRREEPRARAGRSEGEAYGRYRSSPRAVLEDVSWERGLRVATIRISPVTWDPESGRADWAAAITVSIQVTGTSGASTRSGRVRPDRAARVSWRGELLNPEDAERFRQALAPDTCAAGIPGVWFDDSDAWLKIEVDHNGIYGITPSALQAAGAPMPGLDPRTFRLYAGPLVAEVAWAALGWDTLACSGNQVVPAKRHVYERPGFCGGFTDPGGFSEIAIWVRGEEDGAFDTGDQIVFYGLGPDNFRDRFGLSPAGEAYLVNPNTDRTVYWLTWESRLPGAPLRMEVANASPVAGAPEILDGRARLHVERNTFEDPSLYQPGLRWERWFWDTLASDIGAKRFLVDLSHTVPGSTMEAVVRLWGARVPTYAPGEAALHHVEVTANSTTSEMVAWGGSAAEAAFSAQDVALTGIPVRSTSEFLFRVPEIPSSDPNRLDQVHLTWIDIAYRRQLSLDGVAGELEIDAVPGNSTVRIAGPPGGTLVTLDVSDARRPRRLAGGVHTGSELDLAWNLPSTGVVAVASEGGLASPHGLILDSRPGSFAGGTQWLRDSSEALDYVILSYDAWTGEAEVLAEWRRNHLYPFTADTLGGPARPARVRVVAVSDIMDEFAWGMWDPAALRYFLEYCYRFYGGPGDDPMSYCLFLGDANNDPRNYGGTGARGFVPSWEDNRDDVGNIRFGNVQYVSDDELARFDDPGSQGCPDRVTDLYIGRLPVASPAEAHDIIQGKVIRSEDAPDLGAWRTKAILVADDICQTGSNDPLGTTHMEQTEDLSAHIPRLFNQEKIYLYEYGQDCSILTKPEAKRDLIRSWNQGAWLVNYVGHGGDVVWADEHVLDLSDTPLLANDGRFPVVGSFSCSVGKFDNPNRDGLGEAHVRARHGGALVSLAATHLTWSFTNSVMNQYFLDKLFAGGANHPIPAGVALMETKRTIGLQADKYVCLGDPASPPCVPRDSLAIEAPGRLDRGALVSVQAGVPGGGGRSGRIDLEARDSDLIRSVGSITYTLPGALLFRGESPLEADTATVHFTVPISLRGGPDGRIAAYAWGDGWDAAAALDPLEVGGTSVAGNDTLGPTITFSLPGSALEPGQEVSADLEDASGINLTRLFEFRSVLLKISDRTGLEQLRQDLTGSFVYDLGSHTRGKVVFRVPDLESGAYTFSLAASDNFNNRGQTTIAGEVGRAGGAAEFEGLQAAYPNPFDPEKEPTTLMFSLTRAAEIAVRIYTVSGRLVHRVDFAAAAGANVVSWNGQDEAGDVVANGVYLAQVTARRTGSEESRTILERLVVLR